MIDLGRSMFWCLCSSMVIKELRLITCGGIDFWVALHWHLFFFFFFFFFFFCSDLGALGGFNVVICYLIWQFLNLRLLGVGLKDGWWFWWVFCYLLFGVLLFDSWVLLFCYSVLCSEWKDFSRSRVGSKTNFKFGVQIIFIHNFY